MKSLNQLFLAMLLCAPAIKATTILNFEGFPDTTILTTQYSGVTFSNAIILTAGISLNELEFPPRSGSNVVSDNNGPLSIAFSTPISAFSGYFTYAEPLTITVFSSMNVLLGTVSSAYSDNEAISGDAGSSPNELLQFSSLTGISSVLITGDPGGGSFVLDDFSYTVPSAVIAPEPSYSACCGLLVLVFSGWCRCRAKKTCTC